MIQVRKDLTGMIFGRLKVIKQAEDYVDPHGIHRAKWLCECSCDKHTMVEIKGALLTTKKNPTRSCGCLQREAASAIVQTYLKKTNKYSDVLTDEYGDYYVGYCSNTGREFYIDAEDYDVIKDYCWSEHCPSTGFSTLMTFDTKKISILKCISY